MQGWEQDRCPYVVRIDPARAAKVLGGVVVSLGVLHGLYLLHEPLGIDGYLLLTLRQFDLNEEGTVPTYFSSVLLLAVSALLAWASLGERDRVQRWMWWGLAVIFFAMSIDEAVSIHESVAKPFRERLDTTGWLYHAWVIVALPFVGVVGLVYLRFLVRLPRRYALWFAAAGLIYVSGALGMEMVGGVVATTTGIESMQYALTATIEELLELVGLAAFAVGLISYLGSAGPDLEVRTWRPEVTPR